MSYTAILSGEAVKTLDRVDRPTEDRIRRRLRELEEKPHNHGKPLKGLEGLRSSRVGDWWILYTISEERQPVYVIGIRPRGQAYRRL